MPKLAHSLTAAFVVSTLSCSVACTTSGSPASEAGSLISVVEQSTTGAPDFVAEGSLGHRLEVITEPGVYDRASARLTRDDQVWIVTDDDCPAFRQAIERYQDLPALKPGPAQLRPSEWRSLSLPGRRPHGESWVIRTQLWAPDGSFMDVEITAVTSPYAFWVSDTVTAVKSCSSSALD
jgi:hypothetical protein